MRFFSSSRLLLDTVFFVPFSQVFASFSGRGFVALLDFAVW